MKAAMNGFFAKNRDFVNICLRHDESSGGEMKG
jgi:hypothetical protein